VKKKLRDFQSVLELAKTAENHLVMRWGSGILDDASLTEHETKLTPPGGFHDDRR
jgi:hypothetical protein